MYNAIVIMGDMALARMSGGYSVSVLTPNWLMTLLKAENSI